MMNSQLNSGANPAIDDVPVRVIGKKRGEQQCLKPMKTILTVPEVSEIFNRICQAMQLYVRSPEMERKSAGRAADLSGQAAGDAAEGPPHCKVL
jgi:hypothetical protein